MARKKRKSQKSKVKQLILAEPYLESEPRELWLKYVTKHHDLQLTEYQRFILLDNDTPSMGAIDRTLRKIKDKELEQ